MEPAPAVGGPLPSKKSMADVPKGAVSGLFFRASSADHHGQAPTEEGRARNYRRVRERQLPPPSGQGSTRPAIAERSRSSTTYATTFVEKPLESAGLDRALAAVFKGPKGRTSVPDVVAKTTSYGETIGAARGGRRLPVKGRAVGALPEGEWAEPGSFVGVPGPTPTRSMSQTEHCAPQLSLPPQQFPPLHQLGNVPSVSAYMESSYRLAHCRTSPALGGRWGAALAGTGGTAAMAASARSVPADLDEATRILRASFMSSTQRDSFRHPSTRAA